jgi:long-chain acyl-CoA synthetase
VFAANYIWPSGKMTGEELVIVIRPEGDAKLDALVEEIGRRNLRLPDFKRLSGYVVRSEDFPATASLKIKRNMLAEELRKRPRAEAVRALSP